TRRAAAGSARAPLPAPGGVALVLRVVRARVRHDRGAARALGRTAGGALVRSRHGGLVPAARRADAHAARLRPRAAVVGAAARLSAPVRDRLPSRAPAAPA